MVRSADYQQKAKYRNELTKRSLSAWFKNITNYY